MQKLRRTPGRVVAALQDLRVAQGHVAGAVPSGVPGSAPCAAGQRHVVRRIIGTKQSRKLLAVICENMTYPTYNLRVQACPTALTDLR